MRRTILLLATMLLTVLLAGGVALAATRIGDDRLNFIVGTNQADTLLGRGGNDTITGKGDDDVVLGEAGHDDIAGGFGDDFVYGGDDVVGGDFFPVDLPGRGTYGNDTLYGGDGNDFILSGYPWLHGGRDTVKCGDGRDTLYADPSDTVAADCENVFRTARSRIHLTP